MVAKHKKYIHVSGQKKGGLYTRYIEIATLKRHSKWFWVSPWNTEINRHLSAGQNCIAQENITFKLKKWHCSAYFYTSRFLVLFMNGTYKKYYTR